MRLISHQGGTLGFYCAHHYAHTMQAQIRRLPYALKGCDAIFYSVFRHLGSAVQVRPVLKYDDYDDYDDPEESRASRLGVRLRPLKISNSSTEDYRRLHVSAVAYVKMLQI